MLENGNTSLWCDLYELEFADDQVWTNDKNDLQYVVEATRIETQDKYTKGKDLFILIDLLNVGLDREKI